jgi:aminopeptidase N
MRVASVRRGPVTDHPGPASDALVYTHENSKLRIVLPSPARAGQEFTFTVRYRGIPAAGFLIGNNIHNERTFFSDSWPDQGRHWLPMIDHPYDKATGEFIVSAPNHYQVVANGLLVEEADVPGNLRRTHWKQSVPISSWLYALAVARFASHHGGTVDGIPLQTWVYPQNRDAGVAVFEDQSRRVLQFFGTKHRSLPVREAGQHPGADAVWRRRVCERHLLRGKGRRRGQRAGGARDRPSVVRRLGDRARLGRCVAE